MLLEVLVAVAVVVLMITGLVVAVTSALRFTQASSRRSIAVKFSQEGIELTRRLRDTLGWETFANYGSVSGKLWCLDKTASLSPDDGDGICPTNIDGIFSRSVSFTWQDPKMLVAVSVTWKEAGNQFKSELRTYLTQWR